MISKKAKYAINALVFLAKQEDRKPILISEISQSQNIPQKFLETILLELKKAAILASKKGKGGGYYLLKSANDVNLAEVMRLIDGPIALLPCVAYKFYEKCEECHDEESCGIRNIFQEVRNNTVELLKAATLEEIILRENNN